MKITTLNLQGFDNWEERQTAIIDHLTSESPDVVLFQEVVYLPAISPYNQAQLLNDTLGYPYEQSAVTRLQVGVDYPVYREGLAAISRYPIVRSETLVLQQDKNDEHQRIVQLLDLYVDDQVVKLAHVHFSITDVVDYATPQLKETLDLLASRDEQRIMAGDFNLNDLDVSVALWGDEYIASTKYEYISYPSMNKRNDYFLLPKSHAFSGLHTSGDDLSDHRAITATIRLSQVGARTSHRHELAKSPRN